MMMVVEIFLRSVVRRKVTSDATGETAVVS